MERIVALMVGRELGGMYPPAPAEPARTPLLRLRRLARPGAFADVDLTVYRGEIVGLVGLQGHGHFEVARAVFGAPPATGGAIALDGRDLRLTGPRAAIAAGIGFLSEDRSGEGVLPVLSVRENLSLAALGSWVRWGVVDRYRERREVDRLVRRLRIKAASAEAPVEILSGGNQQKVALARWLAAGVRLLVLLEPTAGVDVGARAEIYRILRALADEGGGILLATSDLGEALGLCDRVYAFYRGRVAGTFPRRGRDEAAVLAAMTGQHVEAARLG